MIFFLFTFTNAKLNFRVPLSLTNTLQLNATTAFENTTHFKVSMWNSLHQCTTPTSTLKKYRQIKQGYTCGHATQQTTLLPLSETQNTVVSCYHKCRAQAGCTYFNYGPLTVDTGPLCEWVHTSSSLCPETFDLNPLSNFYTISDETNELMARVGNGWVLVRALAPKSNEWFAATDNLAGTDVYGDPTLGLEASWSIPFNTAVPNWDEYLFLTGDCERYLVTTKAMVFGQYDATTTRSVLVSSASATGYQVKWINREDGAFQEDPWISIHDHDHTGKSYHLLYGENHFGYGTMDKGHGLTKPSINLNAGMYVYIRNSTHKEGVHFQVNVTSDSSNSESSASATFDTAFASTVGRVVHVKPCDSTHNCGLALAATTSPPTAPQVRLRVLNATALNLTLVSVGQDGGSTVVQYDCQIARDDDESSTNASRFVVYANQSKTLLLHMPHANTVPSSITIKACNSFGCGSPTVATTGVPLAPALLDVQVVSETTVVVKAAVPVDDGGSRLEKVQFFYDSFETCLPKIIMSGLGLEGEQDMHVRTTNAAARYGTPCIRNITVVDDASVGMHQLLITSSVAGHNTSTSREAAARYCNSFGCSPLVYDRTQAPAEIKAVQIHIFDDQQMEITVDPGDDNGGQNITQYVVEYSSQVLLSAGPLFESQLGTIDVGEQYFNELAQFNAGPGDKLLHFHCPSCGSSNSRKDIYYKRKTPVSAKESLYETFVSNWQMTTLVDEDFEFPVHADGTVGAAFAGWTWTQVSINVVNIGGSGCTSSKKCDICQSDCDQDVQCADGLSCLQRTSTSALAPGCLTAGLYKDWDYCTREPAAPRGRSKTSAATSDVPRLENQVIQFEYGDEEIYHDINHNVAATDVFFLSIKASPQSWNGDKQRCIEPSLQTIFGSLVNLGKDGCTSSNLCNQCEGDCDSDAECATGLTCFFRDSSSELVPGCNAGGSGDTGTYDYCQSGQTPGQTSAIVWGLPARLPTIVEGTCLARAVAAYGSKVMQSRNYLVKGGWNHLAPGCTVSATGDWAAHWNTKTNPSAPNFETFPPVPERVCENELLKYSDYGSESTFEWTIPASSFSTDSIGQPLRLHLRSSGFRGIYIDDIKLTVFTNRPIGQDFELYSSPLVTPLNSWSSCSATAFYTLCEPGFFPSCIEDDNYNTKDFLLTSKQAGAMVTSISETDFNHKVAESVSKLLKRVCNNCADSHKTIFYHRLTPLGNNVNLYKLLHETWAYDDNMMGTDFYLYSTEADALACYDKPFEDIFCNSQRWQFCNYDEEGVGFPRHCGKHQAVPVTGQWQSETLASVPHYEWYLVELSKTSRNVGFPGACGPSGEVGCDAGGFSTLEQGTLFDPNGVSQTCNPLDFEWNVIVNMRVAVTDVTSKTFNIQGFSNKISSDVVVYPCNDIACQKNGKRFVLRPPTPPTKITVRLFPNNTNGFNITIASSALPTEAPITSYLVTPYLEDCAITTLDEFAYVSGASAANDGYVCDSWFGTLPEAKDRCNADLNCVALHDFNNDGNNWRFCQSVTSQIDGPAATMLKVPKCHTVWQKVLQYGNLPYRPTSNAVGDVTQKAAKGFAKLSDKEINAMRPDAEGYHYFKLSTGNPRSCLEAYRRKKTGWDVDGIVELSSGRKVWCHQSSDGGGWTLVAKWSGTDQEHSNTVAVGEGINSVITPDTASTSKYDDEFINLHTGALIPDEEATSFRMTCGPYTNYYKAACVFSGTLGHATTDDCVKSFLNADGTTIGAQRACNAGSQGLGQHCNDWSTAKHPFTYCSHCPRGTSAGTHGRMGCGHDQWSYNNPGELWVRGGADDVVADVYVRTKSTFVDTKRNMGWNALGYDYSVGFLPLSPAVLRFQNEKANGNGLSRQTAAPSCSVLRSNGQTTSGAYWLKPLDDQPAIYVFCDMLRDDGGWTLVYKIAGHSAMVTNDEENVSSFGRCLTHMR